MALAHQELCFGCGSANLFGLQLEMEPRDGGVTGRFFVKQDHQGAAGAAHAGVMAAALEEAMSLALLAEGIEARLERLELELHSDAPLGEFVALEARLERDEGGRLRAHAVGRMAEGNEPLAEARAELSADRPI